MPTTRRTLLRLGATAGVTAPWSLAAGAPALAAPTPSTPRPVTMTGRDFNPPAWLDGGNSTGLFIGSWDAGPYSPTGIIWYRDAVRYLPGSAPVAVNEAGVIAGDTISHYSQQAFRWQWGTFQSLDSLGGTDTQNGHRSAAVAVSPSGTVIGWSTTDTSDRHATLWTGTRARDLGTLGGPESSASAINAAGQIVGAADTADGRGQPVRWSAGTIRDLGTLGGPSGWAADINGAGQIAGSSDTVAGDQHATLWNRGRIIDLGTPPGSTGSRAVAINSAGQVLVEALDGTAAFLWQAGQRIPIGSAGVHTAVFGLTDQGEVCGTTGTGARSRAFRWRAGLMTPLESLAGGWSDAHAMTPTGIVVGTASTVRTEVPQPAYWPAPAGWDRPPDGAR